MKQYFLEQAEKHIENRNHFRMISRHTGQVCEFNPEQGEYSKNWVKTNLEIMLSDILADQSQVYTDDIFFEIIEEKNLTVYNIGFKNDSGNDDIVQFEVGNPKELFELWVDFCDENNFDWKSFQFVEVA